MGFPFPPTESFHGFGDKDDERGESRYHCNLDLEPMGGLPMPPYLLHPEQSVR